jgi:hypothetical protein
MRISTIPRDKEKNTPIKLQLRKKCPTNYENQFIPHSKLEAPDRAFKYRND